MNFFCDSGGTIFHVTPEKVYQGSANANTIYFVGAFASSCQVTVAYRLPDGSYTVPLLMTRVTEIELTDITDKHGKGFNVWQIRLGAVPKMDENGKVVTDENGNVEYVYNRAITERYGTVEIQFYVFGGSGDGNGALITSAGSSFEVSKGVPIIIPEQSDDYEVLLTQILSVCSQLRSDINNAAVGIVNGKMNEYKTLFCPVEFGSNIFSGEPLTPEQGKLYYDVIENILYNWSGRQFVEQINFAQIIESTATAQATAEEANAVANEATASAEGAAQTATEAKEIAENAETLAKGANPAIVFNDYRSMIVYLYTTASDKYIVGQNVLIRTLNVPDLWVSAVEAESVEYAYTSDEDFVAALTADASVQIGYYKLSALETQKVDLTDYVKNTDYASSTQAGIMKVSPTNGTTIIAGNILALYAATKAEITKRASNPRAIVPSMLPYAVGTTYLQGEAAPTTETVAEFVGQLYLDTTNNATYQCTAITTDEETSVTTYTWVKLIRATDYATTGVGGVIRSAPNYGINVNSTNGIVMTNKATSALIEGKTNGYTPVVPSNLDHAVKVGITTNTETLTDEEKTAACEWLGANKKLYEHNCWYVATLSDGTSGNCYLSFLTTTKDAYGSFTELRNYLYTNGHESFLVSVKPVNGCIDGCAVNIVNMLAATATVDGATVDSISIFAVNQSGALERLEITDLAYISTDILEIK